MTSSANLKERLNRSSHPLGISPEEKQGLLKDETNFTNVSYKGLLMKGEEARVKGRGASPLKSREDIQSRGENRKPCGEGTPGVQGAHGHRGQSPSRVKEVYKGNGLSPYRTPPFRKVDRTGAVVMWR